MKKFSFILNQHNTQKSSHSIFVQKKQSSFFKPVIQAKLTINQPNDIYEQEADAMADKVMRMTDRKNTQQPFFRAAISSIQRKCEHCEEEEKELQRKESSTEATVGPSIDNYIISLSGGRSLNEKERSFFVPRMGYDLSNVHLHTDNTANQSAKDLNALAYTHWNNIVFGSNQYQPDTDGGKKLLAHELTHVIQQQNTAPSIQRKIIIGSTELTVDEQYKKTVRDTFGETALKIMVAMHNDGKTPEYIFKDWEAYRTELRIRSNVVKGMEEAHNKCCNYPSLHPEGYLDPVYWDRKGDKYFETKNPLPKDKGASDAIEAIFKPGAGTELECMTIAIAVEYYSLLKGLGKEKFDKMFPAGAGLVIANQGAPLLKAVINTPKFEEITGNMTDLIPGDYAYFKNFEDYGNKYPNGFWQGESVIYYGDNKFRGFGIPEINAEGILKELVKQYNIQLPDADKKTVDDLKAEGGGFTGWIYRPVVKEILK